MTRKQFFMLLMTLLIIFSAIIIAGGIFIYNSQKALITKKKGNDLNSICQLKVNEINDFLYDKYLDAKQLYDNRVFISAVKNYIENPGNSKNKQMVSDMLYSRSVNPNYQEISIIDFNSKKVIFSSIPGNSGLTCEISPDAQKSIQSDTIIIGYFNISKTDSIAYIEILIPVIVKENKSAERIAIVKLTIDPNYKLFEMMQSWPIESQTAEIYMVKIEKDEIVFLNELRHKKNTVLKFRLPVTEADLPAVRGARGEEGVFTGIDYRGMEVLAAVKKIPDREWVVIVKIDLDEIYSDLYTKGKFIIIIVITLIIVLFFGFIIILRGRETAIAKELIESEARFKSFFENSLIGKSITNPDGKLMVNKAFCNMLGYSQDELESINWQNITHPEDVEKSAKVVKDLTEGKINDARYKKRYIHKDGNIVFTEITSRLQRDIDNKPQYFITTINNITEKAKTEAELRIKNQVFEDSIASQSVANAEGIITHVNPAFLQMWGYKTKEQAIGNSVGSFFANPNDATPVLHALTEKDAWEGEFLAKKVDGKTFISRGLVSSMRNEQGKLTGYQSTNLDITIQKENENKLKRNAIELSLRNRITEIFLTENDDEMYTNVLTVLLEAMESRFGVFGYISEKGDLIVPTMTRTIWDKCKVPEKSIVFPCATWGDSSWPQAIRQKKTFCINEPSNLIPEGHVPITRHISAPVIFKDKVIGLLQFANKKTDYTDEDLALLQILVDAIAPVLDARLNREMQEKGRLRALENFKRSNQELEQFAYVASHDLQEPLRMVSSYTQLLAKNFKEKLDDKADMYINYAVDGAIRMQTLINDLLEYSRVSSRGKTFEKTDSHEILGNALAILKHTIDETGAIITNDDLPHVHVDANQFERIFVNLIGNAIKYRSKIKPVIHISAGIKNNFWIFSVKDNGIGIDPKYKEKVFEIFQRLHTRSEYSGTGIGLAICKRIINRHGGKIWFESLPGEGTTFYFTIPALNKTN